MSSRLHGLLLMSNSHNAWVQERLAEGESILLTAQPSRWWMLLRPMTTWIGLAIIATVLSITADGATAAGLTWAWSAPQIWFGAIAFAFLRCGWAYLEWWNLRFVVTDRRILTRMGVLRIDVYETALSHLRQTQVHVSIRERCFGLGTLLLATAATSTWDTAWPMVQKPAVMQKAVEEARTSYAGL